MNALLTSDQVVRARDVMTRNPLSISGTASIRHAAAFLRAKQMSAAPVINDAGRAVGVVSLSDIARFAASSDWESLQFKSVRNIMNDEVYFVRPHTPLERVVADLAHCKLKRLFVVDDDGVLVGVISAIDALRFLHPKEAAPQESTRAVGRPRDVLAAASPANIAAPTSQLLAGVP